jgi:hypothetical protein
VTVFAIVGRRPEYLDPYLVAIFYDAIRAEESRRHWVARTAHRTAEVVECEIHGAFSATMQVWAAVVMLGDELVVYLYTNPYLADATMEILCAVDGARLARVESYWVINGADVDFDP